MGRLIVASVSYRSGIAGYALLIATALAAGANLILPPLGIQPAPGDDFKLVYLFPIFVLFASLLVGIGSLVGDQKERHLVRHALLPLTRAQIGLARVLVPSFMVLAGLALSESVMLLILMATGVPLEAWRFLFLSFFAGQFLVIVQFPMLVVELREKVRSSRVLRLSLSAGIFLVIAFLLLRTLSKYTDIDPAVASAVQSVSRLDPESVGSSLLLHAAGWGLAAANFVLFLRRRALV